MSTRHPYRLGIDLGGTKIELLALGADGTELFRKRLPTPQGDYVATLDVVVALVEQAEKTLGATASVGIGTPGAISTATGRIKNANSTCLNGQLLLQDLEMRLGRPVRLANDANCFALSEAVDGAAAEAQVVFGVILGTGVGGGLVVDGKLIAGANAIAGEWGHNPLPALEARDLPGPACYCGRTGCIETYLSGPGMTADFQRTSSRTGTPADIVAGAAAGDAECETVLARYESRLARSLAYVINIVDPDAIVLGGGLSNIDRLYERVPQLWQPYVFSDLIRTRLVCNRHGDSSGVRGAAWLWD